MPATCTTTFASLAVDAMRERITQYRGLVRRAHVGGALTEAEQIQAGLLLDQMRLPSSAFKADLQAFELNVALQHRRKELAWHHPHLLGDFDEAVQLRMAATKTNH
jgi:hypothetical protein